jgi:hypothetical protein
LRAILTKYYSQSLYYPLFMQYYGRYFDAVEHCILDSQPNSRDYKYEIDMINDALNNAIKKYDLVVIADLDEIIVPDPDKYKDLGDYLDKFDKRGALVIGYNVVGMPGDAPLDITRKITDQRNYWERENVYDKPMITRIPMTLYLGCHGCNQKMIHDEDLRLFHLRDADVEQLANHSGMKRTDRYMDAFKLRQIQAELIPEKWRVF